MVARVRRKSQQKCADCYADGDKNIAKSSLSQTEVRDESVRETKVINI